MTEDRVSLTALSQAAWRWRSDALIALGVFAFQVGCTCVFYSHLGQPLAPGGVVLLSAGSLALVARRRYPVLVLAVSYVTTLWFAAMQTHGGPIWLSVIVAFCTAIYLRKRAAALGFLAACYVGFLWGPPLVGKGQAPTALFAVSLGAGLVFLVGVAELIRLRGQRSAALAQRREQHALRLASEERLRIARDLHDVLAHNIAVINVQAKSALHLLDREPGRAEAALTVITDVSQQALVELRSVLGVLREGDETAPRTPASSLARVGELVGRARAAGLKVQVSQEGGPEDLPASVDLAAYRILQEALTNSARHAPGSNVSVRVAHADGCLVIEVTDDGQASPGNPVSGSGNGVIGMTERAQALGGTLEAHHRDGGGYRVCARLPVRE